MFSGSEITGKQSVTSLDSALQNRVHGCVQHGGTMQFDSWSCWNSSGKWDLLYQGLLCVLGQHTFHLS
jgi:hypothetical protein